MLGARAYLILRSPAEEVKSSAHCMKDVGFCNTFSSCCIWTAKALSGSHCRDRRKGISTPEI